MKKSKEQEFNICDSVRVKEGSLDGWGKPSYVGFEGRIFDKYEVMGKVQIEIEFDSITLKQMSDKYIKSKIKEGIDYACCDFMLDELELSQPRDTIADVKAARKELKKKYGTGSILDKKGYNVWSPENVEAAINFKADPSEQVMKVSMAYVEKF